MWDTRRIAITLIIMVASLLIIASKITYNETPSTSYSLYTFATEWGSNVCEVKSCSSPSRLTSRFNIHGLWPNNNAQTGPQVCYESKIGYTDLPESLKDTLLQYWNSLYNPEDSFIDHEWTKHGTCWMASDGNIALMPEGVRPIIQQARIDSLSSDLNKAEDFLRLGVELSSIYNIYEMLANMGIYPSNSQTFFVEAIIDAISRQIGGKSFYLDCLDDEHGRQYLQEVRLCLDLNYQIIDCPVKSVENRCKNGESLYYME